MPQIDPAHAVFHYGTPGADAFSGTGAEDTYLIDNLGDTIAEAADGSQDVAFVSINGWTLSANVETAYLIGTASFITGSAGGDTIVANPSVTSNALYGGGGSDTLWGAPTGTNSLYGQDGNDILYSTGSGADLLAGGVGDDQYVITNPHAMISENAGEGTDTAWIGVSGFTLNVAGVEIVRLFGAAANLMVLTSAAVQVAGGSTAATITDYSGPLTYWGQGAADRVYGSFGGNDTFYSGSGVTYMAGNSGDDQYVINNAADTVQEMAGDGTDTAWVAVNGWTVPANVEYGRLTGSATSISAAGATNLVANPLLGSTLIGSAGAKDVFWGSAQNDVFRIGAAGGDVYGDGGADTLAFGAHWGTVQMADFSRAVGDKLDFSASGLHFTDLAITTYADKTLVQHGADQLILYGATGITVTDFIF
jgi:Ca2+-binding RTX toxin-like protein